MPNSNHCCRNPVQSIEKNPYVASPFLEAALLQLNFPAFLRENTWTAAPRGEAIVIRVPTNAIALTDFLTSAKLSSGPVDGMGQRDHIRIGMLSTSQHTCMIQL